MALLFADPNVWYLAIGLGSLAVGWAARHFGGSPAKPVPVPTPAAPAPVPATPSPLDGVLADVLPFLRVLLERQLAAQGSATLEQLLAHKPSTVPAPAPK